SSPRSVSLHGALPSCRLDRADVGEAGGVQTREQEVRRRGHGTILPYARPAQTVSARFCRANRAGRSGPSHTWMARQIDAAIGTRSEEHTSELQSRGNL